MTDDELIDELARVSDRAQAFVELARRKQAKTGLNTRDLERLRRVIGQLESLQDECAIALTAAAQSNCFRLPAITPTPQ